MSSNVEAYVLYKIANATLLNYPFPHFFIRDIFPAEFYPQLLEYLPNQEFFSNVNRAIAVDSEGYKERSICSLRDLEISNPSPEAAHFWNSVSSWILSNAFATMIMEKFGDTIYERFGFLELNDTKPDARLVLDRTNYAIGPHTDAPQKLVSLLFYLPRDERLAHLGTSIYKPKADDFECPGGPHHNFDQFSKILTLPYVPNSLLGFAKTSRSFHGVEPIQDIGIGRHVLLYNLYAKSAPPQHERSKAQHRSILTSWWRK